MENLEGLTRLGAALMECGRATEKLTASFVAFAAIGTEIKRQIERNPALLRGWGQQWPKKERRRIGRKIKRLERAQVVAI